LGVLSFLLDAGLLYVITEAGVYYLHSAAISFVIVFFFNFLLARKFIFPKCGRSLLGETVSYMGIAVVGLALTEICMYIFTEFFGVYYIFSKFLASVIVLLWSFSARKFWLYRQ
jgi:putative flippase GtrA